MATQSDASVAPLAVMLDNYFKGGKKSVLYDYCQDPSRKGRQCILVCQAQGRQTFAWDVSFDPEDPVIILKDQVRWWSRMSLFGVIGVQNVKIKFLSGKRGPKGFQVVCTKPNTSREIANLEYNMKEMNDNIVETYPCGVDIDGNRDGKECENSIYGRSGESYCCVEEASRYRLRLDLIEWIPTLLDYFWQHRPELEGINFLKKEGFIYDYDALARDRWAEAEEPYGKAVKAIELIRGWKIESILWTSLIALVCDICILAVATLLTHSLGRGLAVGSYAVAIEAIPFALLTILGAVLT